MTQKKVNATEEIDTSIFRERFIKLREEHKMSQAQFAVFLGIPSGSVGGYENGTKFPNGKTLFTIATKCDVSADYLLGLQKEPVLKENLKMICEYTGLSKKAVEWLNFLCRNDCSDYVETLGSLLTWESEQLPVMPTLMGIIGELSDYKEEYTRVFDYLDEAYKNKGALPFDEFEKIAKQSEKDLQYAKTFLYDAVFDFKRLIDDYISVNLNKTEKEECYEKFWNEVFYRAEEGE